MYYKREEKKETHSFMAALSQAAVDPQKTEGFLTGEQMIQVSTNRLAALKALYRQQLGFDNAFAAQPGR